MTEQSALVGAWTHAHEEDHAGVEVFRRLGHRLPVSRGRQAFTLRPDLTAVLGTPGADDRGTESAGTWRVEGQVLRVRCPGWAASYEVLAAEADRLDLRPVPDVGVAD